MKTKKIAKPLQPSIEVLIELATTLEEADADDVEILMRENYTGRPLRTLEARLRAILEEVENTLARVEHVKAKLKDEQEREKRLAEQKKEAGKRRALVEKIRLDTFNPSETVSTLAKKYKMSIEELTRAIRSRGSYHGDFFRRPDPKRSAGVRL